MSPSPPVVLTVAGFDPSSGAGVTADIKTIAAHRCYGLACITALTVQSTTRVGKVEPVSPETIRQTLDELRADFDIAAVRIGMLGNAASVRVIARFLRQNLIKHVVLDPVIYSSSGTNLLDAAGVEALKEELIPLASVVTPNADEAGTLTSLAAKAPDSMRQAAAKLHVLGARAVVITGGDLPEIIDLLSFSTSTGVQQREFANQRVPSNSTHGTGCAFATAIACNLALGTDLTQAVLRAKSYVASAIAAAYPLGKGKGPIHHLHRFESS